MLAGRLPATARRLPAAIGRAAEIELPKQNAKTDDEMQFFFGSSTSARPNAAGRHLPVYGQRLPILPAPQGWLPASKEQRPAGLRTTS